jgi:hypothetical protein
MTKFGAKLGVGDQRHALAAYHPAYRPGINIFTGCWVGPRAGLDGCGEEEISYHHQRLNPGLSSPQRVSTPSTLSLPLHCLKHVR